MSIQKIFMECLYMDIHDMLFIWICAKVRLLKTLNGQSQIGGVILLWFAA